MLRLRVYGREGSIAFIPITICPEANSKVSCENENPLATEATRSKSELLLTAFPLVFPNQTGHGGKESRTSWVRNQEFDISANHGSAERRS